MVRRIPKYRHHKHTDQAVVTIDGVDHYLGAHGSEQSQQRYAQLIAEWSANGGRLPAPSDDLTIVELCADYWRHAQTYYRRPDGSATSMTHSVKSAITPLRKLYGPTPAADFGPVALRAVRQTWIDSGHCRSSINKNTAILVRMFKWAASLERVPATVYQSLQTVDGLRRGRSDAKEPRKVRPVPDAYVEAIRPYVSPQVWALIELQLLTGSRPGELLPMRPADLDTTGKIWLYKPAAHKTSWRGDDRVIYLGPRAQQVVAPFLAGRTTTSPLFSPREAEAHRRSVNAKSARRDGQPVTPTTTDRKLGDTYTTSTYYRAIVDACDKAFTAPSPIGRADGETLKHWRSRLTPDQKRQLTIWRREHRWHPHQLRHNAATALRREFGIEAARVILGHKSASVTTIYAEVDHARAVDVIGKVG